MIVLEWRQKIVDELIRENPDATIKDFVQLIEELERIKSSFTTISVFDILHISRELKCAS